MQLTMNASLDIGLLFREKPLGMGPFFNMFKILNVHHLTFLTFLGVRHSKNVKDWPILVYFEKSCEKWVPFLTKMTLRNGYPKSGQLLSMQIVHFYPFYMEHWGF